MILLTGYNFGYCYCFSSGIGYLSYGSSYNVGHISYNIGNGHRFYNKTHEKHACIS